MSYLMLIYKKDKKFYTVDNDLNMISVKKGKNYFKDDILIFLSHSLFIGGLVDVFSYKHKNTDINNYYVSYINTNSDIFIISNNGFRFFSGKATVNSFIWLLNYDKFTNNIPITLISRFPKLKKYINNIEEYIISESHKNRGIINLYNMFNL